MSARQEQRQRADMSTWICAVVTIALCHPLDHFVQLCFSPSLQAFFLPVPSFGVS